MKHYIPHKGDLIAVTFDPQSVHEQKGRRPALIVSNILFNQRTGLTFVCPITSTDRGYPFHVAVSDDTDVSGFVMVEQLKSIDYRARKATFIGKVSTGVLDEVLSIVDACIY